MFILRPLTLTKFTMKIQNIGIIFATFLIPLICGAGEPSKGTVIMISSVSGWLLLSSGLVFWKEIRRNRK